MSKVETNRLDDRIVKKMLRGTMVVMVVTVLSTMLGMLVDGIVIGRFLGKFHMSAYGIANPMFNLLVSINAVLAAGIEVLCARYIGTGDFRRAKQVHTVSYLLAILISVILFLIMFFGSDMIAGLLGASGKDINLLPEAGGYLRGLAIGVPGLMLAFLVCSIMQIDSDPKRIIIGVLTMTVVNVTGDFMVAKVFHGGLFQMGLVTSISYYIALLIAMTHYLKKNNVLTFTFRGLKPMDALRVIMLGAPSGIVNFCIMMRNIVMNRLLLLVSTSIAVAAFSIQNTLTAATGAFSTGLGMAVLLVSGIIAGEEDRVSATNLIRIMNKWGAIIALVMMAVSLIFAYPLASIFAGDDEVLLEQAAFCVRVYSFGFICNVLNSMMENYVQGMGRVAFANVLVVLDTFVYCTLVAWALGWGLSLPLGFIWAAWPIGTLMVQITIVILAWKRNGHFPRRAEDFTFLPEGYGVDPENSIDFTAYSLEEIVACSVEVEKFCLGHGADQTLAHRIHYCIEELGKNIIIYGFSDGKNHSIDLRVIKKKDDYIIRIRDDCKVFDPKAWFEMYQKEERSEDVTKNIGIRSVMSLTKDLQYVNTMQLNNLLIRF